MTVELKAPSVGESVADIEIGEWIRKEGEQVEVGEPLAVIETDKANLDLPAPVSGRLSRILKKAGERVAVGEVIGYMDESMDTQTASPQGPALSGNGGRREPEVKPPAPAATRPVDETPEPARPKPREPARQRTEVSQRPAAPQATDAPSTVDRTRHEDTVPMTPIRRTIARRLVAAQQNAALLTTINEIDMSSVNDLRSVYQDEFVGRHGVKLGLMSFFVKATVKALEETPELNAEIRDESIVYRRYCDMGIAVATPKGLVVPVIRNVELLSIAQIEKAIADLATRARNGQLKVEEAQGGTFTISNGGVYGSLLSTPIVNPPQSGVLGLHAIEDRPVVVTGQIVPRPMMYVALTYDHRIVDGREAVTFLKRIRQLIEQPSRLILEI